MVGRLKLPAFVDTPLFGFLESTMAKKHPFYAPEFCRQMIELVRAGRTPDPRRWVLNLHMLPRNTVLDWCSRLDEMGAPIMGPAGPEMCHIGSEPVRECIEKLKPVVSLHSFPPLDYRTQMMGSTRSFAPGTEAHAGCAVGTWLTFRKKELIASAQTREDILADRWDPLLVAVERAAGVIFKKPLDIIDLFRKPLEDMRAQKRVPKASAGGPS
jgi:hypothetical protein